MLKEFRKFAMRGNVVDMAVGIIIGAAFGSIVSSLVADIIMPPIGLVLGNVDFTNLFLTLKEGELAGPYAALADAQAAGFLIIAFAIFLLIRGVNRLQEEEQAPPEEPTTKDCPFCFTEISIHASRCPNCTSQLEAS